MQVLFLHLGLYTEHGTFSSLPENTDSARTHTVTLTHTHSLTRPALDMQRACVNISDK